MNAHGDEEEDEKCDIGGESRAILVDAPDGIAVQRARRESAI